MTLKEAIVSILKENADLKWLDVSFDQMADLIIDEIQKDLNK